MTKVLLIKNKIFKFEGKNQDLMTAMARNIVVMCFSAFVLNASILAHADEGYFTDNLQDGRRRFPIEEVSVSVPSDSTLWDFSNIEHLGKSRKIRISAMSDSTFAVISNDKQFSFKIFNDSLWLIGRETKLSKENCKFPLINLTDSGKKFLRAYSSSGTYCGRQGYFEVGNISYSKTNKGILIIAEDTIKDSYMLHWHIVGDASSGEIKNGVHILHIKDVYCWIDCIHKYPILITKVERYNNEDCMLIEDSVSYLFDPHMQDYVFGRPLNDKPAKVDDNDETVTEVFGDVLTTNDGNNLDVEFSVLIDTDVTFLLCDSFGRVFSSRKGNFNASNGPHSVRFDISTLNMGNYIVRLETPMGIYVAKFTKAQ